MLKKVLLCMILIFIFIAPVLADGDKKQKSMISQSKLKNFIILKMEYDRQYFTNILSLKKRGKKATNLTKDKFNLEVGRAKLNLPVLNKFFTEIEMYKKGTYFTMPLHKDAHRVYTNLMAILNIFSSIEKKDYDSALKFGKDVLISKKENLGLTTGKGADYYVELFREYYFMMALAHYRLQNDEKAVEWFARIQADADLQKLKAQIEQKVHEKKESKVFRKEELRIQPIAIMKFENLGENKNLAWLEKGVAEILTSDLTHHTDLILTERSQIAKVFGELELSYAGFTDLKNALEVGAFLKVGTLLVGSYKKRADGKIYFTLRLIDAENGNTLESIEGEIDDNDNLFKQLRKLSLDLFVKMGWMYEEMQSEIMAIHAPKAGNIRKLMTARVLKATKSEEAKSLYAQAIAEDPALANLFADLKSEFKDISATVALTPFVNITGNGEDMWMVTAVSEAMNADLPKLNFTVVERTKIDVLYKEQMGQVLDAQKTIEMGKAVGADFLLMGGIFHQNSQIKISARFVEVKSGVVLLSATSENLDNNMMLALVDLSKSIAEKLNEKLSKETIDQLIGKKMTQEEFEKYVKQQLTKDSLNYAKLKKVDKKEQEKRRNPAKWPFYVASGGVVVGTVFTVLGFKKRGEWSADAHYYDALYSVSSAGTIKDQYKKDRDAAAVKANIWTGIGIAGAGVTTLSLAYMIYDFVKRTKKSKTTQKKVVVNPIVIANKNNILIGINGSF